MARYVSPKAVGTGTKFRSPNLASFLMGGTKSVTSFAGKILNKTGDYLKKIWGFSGGLNQYGDLGVPGGGEGIDQYGDIQWGGSRNWNKKDKSPRRTKKKKTSRKGPLFNSKVSRRIENLRKGDSLANLFGKIYTLMIVQNEYETAQRELEKSFEQERAFEEGLKQKEMINYLNKIAKQRKDKVPAEVAPPRKAPPEPPEPPTGGFLDKVKSVATKVGGSAIAGGAVVGGLALTTNKVAAAESGGNYNIMNLGPGEKKGENIFDLENMTIGQLISFQEKRGAKFGGYGIGKAAGKYQMMPDFIQGYMMKNGKRSIGIAEKTFGPNWRSVKFSAENQEKMMAVAKQGYAEQLTASGVPVTDFSMYMMHFTGSVSKTKKLVESPDATPVSSILGSLASSQNKRVAEQTVGQYKSELQKKYGFDFKPEQTTNLASVPQQTKQGSSLYNMSVDLMDTIKSTVKQEGSVILNSINTFLQGGESNVGIISAQRNDKSPLLKAQE